MKLTRRKIVIALVAAVVLSSGDLLFAPFGMSIKNVERIRNLKSLSDVQRILGPADLGHAYGRVGIERHWYVCDGIIIVAATGDSVDWVAIQHEPRWLRQINRLQWELGIRHTPTPLREAISNDW